MDSLFWTHTIWFLILGVIIVLQLAIILYKCKKRILILAIFITVSGIIFSLEIGIYTISAYQYFPMILRSSVYDDGVAGNFFSQLLITGTALLLAVFSIQKYWYIFVAFAYGAIEVFFLYLGIYEQNWYRTWMTVFALPVVFWGTDWIYRVIYNKPFGNFKKYVLIFFGLVTLHHNLLWIMRLTDMIKFTNDFPPESIVKGIESIIPGSKVSNKGSLLVNPYEIMISVTCIVVYFLKISWKWKVPLLAVLFIPHYYLMQSGLMIYGKNWFIAGTAISIFCMYFFVYILDKAYSYQKSKDYTRVN
jgi:hypothetical protein